MKPTPPLKRPTKKYPVPRSSNQILFQVFELPHLASPVVKVQHTLNSPDVIVEVINSQHPFGSPFLQPHINILDLNTIELDFGYIPNEPLRVLIRG